MVSIQAFKDLYGTFVTFVGLDPIEGISKIGAILCNCSGGILKIEENHRVNTEDTKFFGFWRT